MRQERNEKKKRSEPKEMENTPHTRMNKILLYIFRHFIEMFGEV